MRWTALAFLPLLLPAAAWASAAELFDLGPAMGRAGAVCATEDGGVAAYYNPAGLAFRARPQLRLGGQLMHSELRLRHQRQAIARPFGLTVEAASKLPLEGFLADRIAVGLAFYIIPDTVLAVDTPAASQPYFPYYHNRSDRLMALPALAVRPIKEVAIGIGVNYFAAVKGKVGGAQGANRDMQADVLEDIVGHAALIGGLRVELGRVSAGLTYRGRFSVPFETESTTDVLGSRIRIALAAEALFSPETWVLGAAYRGSGWGASLNLSWRRWSEYPAPFAQVDADLPVPLSSSGETFAVQGEPAEVSTRDVPRVAVSLEKAFPLGLVARAGYAYEPSAFSPQPGITNMLDGAKQIGALGIGWRGPGLETLAWGLEAAVQAHWMEYARLSKDASLLPDEDPTTPGQQTSNLGFPTIAGGGLVLAASLGIFAEWGTAEAPP